MGHVQNFQRLNGFGGFPGWGGFQTAGYSINDGDFYMNSVICNRPSEFERSVYKGLSIMNTVEYALPRAVGFLNGLANFFGLNEDDQRQYPPVPANGFYNEPPRGRYYDERPNGPGYYPQPGFSCAPSGSAYAYPELDMLNRKYSFGGSTAGNSAGNPGVPPVKVGEIKDNKQVKTYYDRNGKPVKEETYKVFGAGFDDILIEEKVKSDAPGQIFKVLKRSALLGTELHKGENVEPREDGRLYKTYKNGENTVEEHINKDGFLVTVSTDAKGNKTTTISKEKIDPRKNTWVEIEDSADAPVATNAAKPEATTTTATTATTTTTPVATTTTITPAQQEKNILAKIKEYTDKANDPNQKDKHDENIGIMNYWYGELSKLRKANPDLVKNAEHAHTAPKTVQSNSNEMIVVYSHEVTPDRNDQNDEPLLMSVKDYQELLKSQAEYNFWSGTDRVVNGKKVTSYSSHFSLDFDGKNDYRVKQSVRQINNAVETGKMAYAIAAKKGKKFPKGADVYITDEDGRKFNLKEYSEYISNQAANNIENEESWLPHLWKRDYDDNPYELRNDDLKRKAARRNLADQM